MGAGSGKFTLVGYSLGGGIAASFASYFPDLLSAVVLLAPSGLIRDEHISFQSRFLYSHGLVPESILTALVRRRLTAGPLIKPKHKPDEKVSAEDALTEELAKQKDGKQVLSRAYPNLTLANAVNWQVHTHPGFVHSFMSSMQHAPILKQRQLLTWRRLGRQIASASAGKGLTPDKVLILGGDHDPIIVKNELIEDAEVTLGRDVVFKFFDAGHEFPSTKYDEVAQFIQEKLR